LTGEAIAFGYDETEIAARLVALPPSARVLFACACAERLMPAYRWFCDITGSTSFGLVREALDAAWSADIPDKTVAVAQVTALMPREDEEETFPGSAIAQNAVACVAYALEARQNGDVQASAWAARQLYEAADVVVQQGSAVQTYIENIDLEAPVQLMLRGVYTVLDDVASMNRAALLARAREDGDAFLGYISSKG
jgi:Protein of unknown function (DUF416)